MASGNYVIVNGASGLVLGDPGYSQSDGTPIIQWQLNDGLNEQLDDPILRKLRFKIASLLAFILNRTLAFRSAGGLARWKTVSLNLPSFETYRGSNGDRGRRKHFVTDVYLRSHSMFNHCETMPCGAFVSTSALS
jgi:hypothetical protein